MSKTVDIHGYVLQLVFCVLSFIGCLFIIFTFKRLKWNSKVHYRLVFWLACAQLIYTIEGFIAAFTIYPNPVVCVIALDISNFGEKAGWMFASCISIHLLVLSKGYTNKFLEKKETLSCIICVVAALLLVAGFHVYMVLGHGIVPIDNTCTRYWVRKEELTVLAFPLFLVFNVGCVSVVFYKCFRDIVLRNEERTRLLDTKQDSLHYFLLRLAFQPLIFFVGYIITFADVINNSINGRHLTDYDDTFFLQTNYIGGFLCAVVYGFTPSLTKDYRTLLSKQERPEFAAG